MSKTLTAYLLHQGSVGNAYYSLFPKRPRVTRRSVRSGDGQSLVDLFETPDCFIFNFCLPGVERRFKTRIPLGAIAKLTIRVEDVEPFGG